MCRAMHSRVRKVSSCLRVARESRKLSTKSGQISPPFLVDTVNTLSAVSQLSRETVQMIKR